MEKKLIEALKGVMRSYEAYCPQRYYSDDNVAFAEDVFKELEEKQDEQLTKKEEQPC